MANVSTAKGTIAFDKAFAEKKENAALIEKVVKGVGDSCGYYGVDEMTPTDDPLVYDFRGSGRWSFISTLKEGGGFRPWLDEGGNEDEYALCRALAEQGASIHYDFVDCEEGMGSIYGARIDVSFRIDGKEIATVAKETDFTDIDYSARTVCAYGFDIGYDLEEADQRNRFVNSAVNGDPLHAYLWLDQKRMDGFVEWARNKKEWRGVILQCLVDDDLEDIADEYEDYEYDVKNGIEPESRRRREERCPRHRQDGGPASAEPTTATGPGPGAKAGERATGGAGTPPRRAVIPASPKIC